MWVLRYKLPSGRNKLSRWKKNKPNFENRIAENDRNTCWFQKKWMDKQKKFSNLNRKQTQYSEVEQSAEAGVSCCTACGQQGGQQRT